MLGVIGAAYVDAAIEPIARNDVAEIETFAIRGSRAGAIGGAAVGALFGGAFALRLAFTPCQPSCGGVEASMALLAIGIPIAAGFGGYYAFGESTARVLYRAPYMHSGTNAQHPNNATTAVCP